MAETDLTTKLKTFPKIKAIEVNEESHVSLKWTKVELAEKYDIKRSEKPTGPFAHVDWAKKTNFTDETVEKDITYWYKVIAWKRLEGKKTSTKASAVSPVVVSDIPAVPELSATAKNKTIKLKWNKGEGDKFFIYRKCDCFSRPIFVGEAKKAEFTDETPIPGQAYHYSVQVLKKGEEDKLLHGNFSSYTDACYLNDTQIISAKASHGKTVNITVRLVCGCDGYILERSENKDSDFIEVARTEELTQNLLSDKAPARLKTYYYRVRAYKIIDKKEFYSEYCTVKPIKTR